jgi:hypothetical protein
MTTYISRQARSQGRSCALKFPSSTLSRRRFLAGATGSGILLSTRKLVYAANTSLPLVPNGRGTRSVQIGAPTIIRNNVGGDWVAAWAEDDCLYSPSDDGGGFDVNEESIKVLPELTEQQKRRMRSDDWSVWDELTPAQNERLETTGPFGTICFNRLSGTNPSDLQGVTINRMRDFTTQDRVKQTPSDGNGTIKVGADGATWKTAGCTCIDGVIYLSIARRIYGEMSGDPQLRETSANASLLKSTNFGRTWTRSARDNMNSPMFPGARFSAPYLIDYGRGRHFTDGADLYVYAVSNNGFWDNGDTLMLGRVPRQRIGLLDGTDWEFFTGGDGGANANWTRNPTVAAPILQNSGRLGQAGVVYLPARGRYMTIGWYYAAGSGKAKGPTGAKETVWDFYESPAPWGPWKRVASHTWSSEGYFCPSICPKFQSRNRIYVLTTGYWRDPNVYRLTVVPIDLS